MKYRHLILMIVGAFALVYGLRLLVKDDITFGWVGVGICGALALSCLATVIIGSIRKRKDG